MADDLWEGDLARADVQFTDNGVLMNPDTVTFTYTIDGASKATDTWPGVTQVVNDGAGLFHFFIDTTGKPGRYAWRWSSTGDPQAVTPDGTFDVHVSHVIHAP